MQPAAAVGHAGGGSTAEYQPGSAAEELIVQFKESATDNELADALAQAELEPRHHVHTRAMKDHGNPGFLRAATRLPLEQAIRKLKGHAAVAFAEPNWIVTHQTVSN
ncbi:MAG TPA: hypothetical protein VNZ22_06120, partial [Bacillota bacterium]|nr:hypothetical protein [Bacillota bacterium]